MYKWEDKGSSFTKLDRDQYIASGEQALSNQRFYTKYQRNDPTEDISKKKTQLVNRMVTKGEISERTADNFRVGDDKLPRYYNLVKTHKIPLDEVVTVEDCRKYFL